MQLQKNSTSHHFLYAIIYILGHDWWPLSGFVSFVRLFVSHFFCLSILFLFVCLSMCLPKKSKNLKTRFRYYKLHSRGLDLYLPKPKFAKYSSGASLGHYHWPLYVTLSVNLSVCHSAHLQFFFFFENFEN